MRYRGAVDHIVLERLALLTGASTSELSNILGQPLLTAQDVPYADEFCWGAVTLWGCWI
jgi:hypothetical protein